MTGFSSTDHFLKVCVEEQLSEKRAQRLLALSIRRGLQMDDPVMTMVLVLGLIEQAALVNVSALRSIPQKLESHVALASDHITANSQSVIDAAAMGAATKLADVVKIGLNRTILRTRVAWTAISGTAALVLFTAVLFGVQIGHLGQTVSDEPKWHELIMSNPDLPELVAKCAGERLRISSGTKQCGVWVTTGGEIQNGLPQ